MDSSQIAEILEKIKDDQELSNSLKCALRDWDAAELLQHFWVEAVIKDDCTVHTEHERIDGVPTQVERRWYRSSKDPLGKGAYGHVWLEQEQHTSRQRAVKVIDKYTIKSYEIDYKKEILALSKFSKPDYQQQEVLVNFLGWFETNTDLCLYMEYFELGDLEKNINADITEEDVKDIATNLLNGLRIMHEEHFTHRDLKPGNIFVVRKPPVSRWWVKVGDFGISKRVKDDSTALNTLIGTRHYMAPEVTGDLDTDNYTSNYTNAVDMWSLGCVLYKVATQRVPFPGPRDIRKYCDGRDRFPEQPLASTLSTEGVSFLERLLTPHPEGRLSATEALQIPWLSQRQPNIVLTKKMAGPPASGPSVQMAPRMRELNNGRPSQTASRSTETVFTSVKPLSPLPQLRSQKATPPAPLRPQPLPQIGQLFLRRKEPKPSLGGSRVQNPPRMREPNNGKPSKTTSRTRETVSSSVKTPTPLPRLLSQQATPPTHTPSQPLPAVPAGQATLIPCSDRLMKRKPTLGVPLSELYKRDGEPFPMTLNECFTAIELFGLGVPLSELYKRDGEPFPMILNECFTAIELFGLDVPDIYRLPSNTSHLSKLRSLFNFSPTGVGFIKPQNFYNDIIGVATLVKDLFNHLTSPLFIPQSYPNLMHAAHIDDDIVRRDCLRAIIKTLPLPNHATLQQLMLHLDKVQSHSMQNHMNARELAICFGFILIPPGSREDNLDGMLRIRVVETILVNVHEIF